MKIHTEHKTGYRVVVLLKDSNIVSKNVSDRNAADDFILTACEVKEARILDNSTGQTEIVRF